MRASGADDAAIDQHRAEDNARQEAFVKRRAKKGHLSWAPRKRHRKQAFLYLVSLNHQLKQCTGKALVHFQQPKDKSERKRWNKWPLCSISPDIGSDELAGHNYARTRRRDLASIQTSFLAQATEIGTT